MSKWTAECHYKECVLTWVTLPQLKPWWFIIFSISVLHTYYTHTQTHTHANTHFASPVYQPLCNPLGQPGLSLTSNRWDGRGIMALCHWEEPDAALPSLLWFSHTTLALPWARAPIHHLISVSLAQPLASAAITCLWVNPWPMANTVWLMATPQNRAKYETLKVVWKVHKLLSHERTTFEPLHGLLSLNSTTRLQRLRTPVLY